MRGADLATVASGSDTVVGSAWRATALYAILAVATTWPLVLHLTRSLPIDQGDSLLNCWILSWNADHLLAWFWGNASAFQDYWSPPIFHPAPLALAYSEHLFAESLQIAPIYALTRNVFLRAEYEYVQFAPIANLVVDVNTVRGGLGVKF